jgi:hypothetical protein
MFFSWLPIGGLGAQDRSILQAKPPTAHENMELRYRILSGKVASGATPFGLPPGFCRLLPGAPHKPYPPSASS